MVKVTKVLEQKMRVGGKNPILFHNNCELEQSFKILVQLRLSDE